MAHRLIWSPAARQDLRDLLAYIAEDDPHAAQQFVRGVFRAVHGLSELPESGRIVPEFEEPLLREVIRRPCRVVYRIDQHETLIEIVRVWHAARGIPEI